MEWLPLILPIIAVIAMRVFWSRNLVWWEFSLPLVCCVLVIGIAKLCAQTFMVQDVEYWGGWMTQAAYFEPWDEEVPCTHARYHTVYSTDSKGNTTSSQVFDGWEHPYDVDYHRPKWQVEDSNGFVFNVTQQDFEYYARIWHSREFRDMHRDYHRLDGDAYVALWPKDFDTLQPVTSIHSYQNRVARSHSIYEYPEIDPKRTPVYDYPQVNNFTCPSVLSASPWPGADGIDKINALLGASKKVRIWVLIWEGDLPRQIGLNQEAYWKGSNKNELVICLNVKSKQNPTINWCHIFTWSQSEELKSSIKGFLGIDHTQLDFKTLTPFLKQQVQDHWTKRNWHDFDYLSVELSTGWMIFIWILTAAVTIGTSYYCVVNEVDNEPN
jgi:hypothetical protein